MAEIEAKFLIRHPEQIDNILAMLADRGYAPIRQSRSELIDTYLDTADWGIFRSGWVFRVRESGVSVTLILKSLGSREDDLFIREEIEQPLAANFSWPEQQTLPVGEVQQRLDALAGGMPRIKLFTISNNRRTHLLSVPGSPTTRLELDFDETRISAIQEDSNTPRQLHFNELEVELVEGVARDVVELATVLREHPGLIPAQLSKFERGLLAAGLSAPGIFETPPEPDLAASDLLITLLFASIETQQAILVSQQPVAWEGLDSEGVHKMRVAIRRIRTLTRAFHDVLFADNEASLEPELRWLAGELGHARDADVGMGDIARIQGALPPHLAPRVEAFVDNLKALRADAYANLVGVFSSDRYACLMNRLSYLVNTGATAATRATYGALSIVDSADDFIHASAQKLIERGDRLDPQSSARELHKLRIRAKRLRYLMEFYDRALSHRWLPAIRELQILHDILGEHQDAVTSRDRLRHFRDALPADQSSADLRQAVELMIVDQERRMAGMREQLPAAWSRCHRAIV